MNDTQHSDETRKWFSVRSLYRYSARDAEQKHCYEERVVLFFEHTFEAAIQKAELEGQAHATEMDKELLDLFSAFEIADDSIGIACEVFSLIRNSDLTPNDYIDRMFDTGDELAKRCE